MKSIKYDLKIILYTFPVVLTANNADSVFSSTPFPINKEIFSGDSTEINLVFEKTSSKKKYKDEYSVRLAGNWGFNGIQEHATNKSKTNLKLLKVNSATKKS
jgi:hypothetical protein